jgi:hypothetical protein
MSPETPNEGGTVDGGIPVQSSIGRACLAATDFWFWLQPKSSLMKWVAFMCLLLALCVSCDTVQTDRTLRAELRALPDHSLVEFGTPMGAHDGGSTSIPLGFSNGQEYMLKCFCLGNLMIGSWKTNDWENGFRFQISRIGQRERVETIRLDSPVANRLSVLLRDFAEDSPGNEWSGWAVLLSKMMHRSTYDAAKVAAGFMQY